jgi:hypothetical protein
LLQKQTTEKHLTLIRKYKALKGTDFNLHEIIDSTVSFSKNFTREKSNLVKRRERIKCLSQVLNTVLQTLCNAPITDTEVVSACLRFLPLI